MLKLGMYLFNLSLVAVGLLLATARAEVTVTPFGFTSDLEEGGEVALEIVLSNSNEEDVTFFTNYELVPDQDERQDGPRRDDLGDVLRQFNLPFNRTDGMCWDGDNLWACSYGDSRYCCFDEDFDVICNYQTAGQVVGMTWDPVDGVFWMGHWSTHEVYLYDREGEHIGTLEMPVNCNGGYATDGEYFYWISEARNFPLYKMDRDLNIVAEVPNLLDKIGHSTRVMSIEYVHAHRDGHFWVTTREPGYCVQLDVDWEAEDATVVQEFGIRDLWAHEGLTHDGQNLYQGGYGGERNAFIFDDGITEFDMLEIDPVNGVIHGGDSQAVSVDVITEGYEAGVYNILIKIKLINADGMGDEFVQSSIEISAVISVGSPTGNLTGIVTDASSNEPVEDVTIAMDRYQISRFTDENGVYSINDLPPGEYQLTFSAPDYLPSIENIQAEENNDVELDIELLHSECSLDPGRVVAVLEPDQSTEAAITLSNPGNGPLTYTTDRQLIGDANADPWTLRREYMVGRDQDDSRIESAVFANDHFYISGAHGGTPWIYILDRDGNLVDHIVQPIEDARGLRDLGWDGEHFWGAVGRTIYEISLDGEILTSFESQSNPTTCLTYDTDRNWIWASGTTTDIIGYDLEGNEQASIDRNGLRFYGLAYWPVDPDGMGLYIHHQDADLDLPAISKVDPDDGEISFVTYLETQADASAAGLEITNQFDVYSWVLLEITSNSNNAGGDRVNIWQLAARKDWMQIEPVEGQVEAGGSTDLTLTLDATGLPTVRYEGFILFEHDGVGSTTELPIVLDIQAGRVHTQRTMDFHIGWNMVSLNVDPDDHDVITIFQPLVEAGSLILLKNDVGQFYNPEFGFGNIQSWMVNEGYLVKVSDDCDLDVEGTSVLADDPIQVFEGWQMVSYFPRVSVEAPVALSGIVDQLIIAKDGNGNFYNPEFGFNNMQPMSEGRGFQLKMSGDAELVYQLGNQRAAFNQPRPLQYLPEMTSTGRNMSLLLLADKSLSGESAVYSGDRLVGTGVITDGICGLAVWGDDPTTAEVDGLEEGEEFEIHFRDGSAEAVFQVDNVLAGSGLVYKTDDFTALDVSLKPTVPELYYLSQNYPNPFNNATRISYGLPATGQVSLNIYDLSGRIIQTLVNGQVEAGHHSIAWDAGCVPSGLYLIQLESANFRAIRKVILTK